MWGEEVSPETCVTLVHQAGNITPSSSDAIETRDTQARKSVSVYRIRCRESPIEDALLSKHHIPDLRAMHSTVAIDSDVK